MRKTARIMLTTIPAKTIMSNNFEFFLVRISSFADVMANGYHMIARSVKVVTVTSLSALRYAATLTSDRSSQNAFYVIHL